MLREIRTEKDCDKALERVYELQDALENQELGSDEVEALEDEIDTLMQAIDEFERLANS